jgi:hypothetical protein
MSDGLPASQRGEIEVVFGPCVEVENRDSPLTQILLAALGRNTAFAFGIATWVSVEAADYLITASAIE